MRRGWRVTVAVMGLGLAGTAAGTRGRQAQKKAAEAADPPNSSYLPVIEGEFRSVFTGMSAGKAQVMKRQTDLLTGRYDLGNRPVAGVTMSRGKPVQGGVRVKLPAGGTWEALAKMTPKENPRKDLLPAGFMPLPHPHHPQSRQVLPKVQDA